MATAKKPPRNNPALRARRWPKVVLVLGVIAALTAWYFRGTVMAQAVAGTSYGARVACSCRFIGGRDLKDCEKDFEPGMGLVSLSEDEGAKSVTASVPLLASQTATFREGYGCVLEKWNR
ncbi:MAG: hypothetical protein P0Y56_10945 [Candidatus Andeanibacterium colombiense]|uniref:Uncharacterized protein n=1 Tax=Candidatus Andeanibacterium colombiense TaxID=3121345 RepID=A0AAJ6BNE6_9SPHN|nr:MAG: hypothetical protein P0Y56_10945 [Sphingomonadaceae bacterium]